MIVLRILRILVQYGLLLFSIGGIIYIVGYIFGLVDEPPYNIWVAIPSTALGIYLYVWVWNHDWDYPSEYYENWFDFRKKN